MRRLFRVTPTLDNPIIDALSRQMSHAVENLVIEIRDHYVAQFRSFVLDQRETCRKGEPEVKFQLPIDSNTYRQFAVVDFVCNDKGPEAIVFEPETVLEFDRLEGHIADSKLIIDALRWDSVFIRHDAPSVEDAIAEWFEKWFDPDEIKFDPTAELSSCIHAVFVAPDHIEVDFGTAPVEAFWELLEYLATSKARNIFIES